MKIQTLLRLSGMILLAVVVSVLMLGLVYALQNSATALLPTIGWNK